jgi:hypothetical protein
MQFLCNQKRNPKSQIPDPKSQPKPAKNQHSRAARKSEGNHSIIAIIDNTGFRAAAVAAVGGARHGHEVIDAEGDEGQDDEEDDDDDGDDVVFLHLCEIV